MLIKFITVEPTFQFMASRETSGMKAELSPKSDWNFQFIGGDKRQVAKTTQNTDPSTGETFCEVPMGNVQDVDDAYKAARKAQPGWADTTPQQRARVVRQASDRLKAQIDEVTNLLVTESGSTHTKSQIEIRSSLSHLQEAATMPTRLTGEYRESMIPGKENLVKREPVGTVGIITAWNYPLFLGLRAVGPALALGNTVVLKPASETAIIGGLLLAKLFEATDLPDGVFNVVVGSGRVVGNAITSHEGADVISFTGSTSVGKDVAGQAASNMAFPAMELGGNAPHIVLEDSDIDAAVSAGVFGSFLHQGQACNSINRHLVHESIYEKYVDSLVDEVEELPAGSAHNEEVIVGPMIDDGQRDTVFSFIERSVDNGATLETGGEYSDLVIEPTVLSDVTNDMAAACNEHFGPIAPVISFTDDEEAVQIANDTQYGLSASVFSGDRGRAMDVADRIDSGMVHINDSPMNDEPQMPYGGTKDSGLGRYNGDSIMREFTEEKWISVQQSERRYPF